MTNTLTFMHRGLVDSKQELPRKQKAEKADVTISPSRGRVLNLAARPSTRCGLFGGRLSAHPMHAKLTPTILDPEQAASLTPYIHDGYLESRQVSRFYTVVTSIGVSQNRPSAKTVEIGESRQSGGV